MPSNATCKAFQSSWTEKYGVKIASRDSATSTVISVSCLFCEHCGKEGNDTKKCKATTNTKYFTAPWRCDNIISHLTTCHKTRYDKYKKLKKEEQKCYFDQFKSKNNVFVPLGLQNRPGISMMINKDIVETIIGKLLIDEENEEHDLNNRRSAIEIFTLQEIDDERINQENDNLERYLLTYQNILQFKLLVTYISLGLSFRQCVGVLQSTKEHTNMGQIGNCNMLKVITTARYICAINYQHLYKILNNVVAFSIAFDGGNKCETHYLAVRVRFTIGNKLHNFHVVAIPMRDVHTGENMAELITGFLEVLCPSWKIKLIGISSDGASSMTGRISGCVTRIHRNCVGPCYRVWCGAHQLDLVIQKVFKKLLSEEFVGQVMAVTGYLQRQVNLLIEMKNSKCPRFIDTRWLSMGKLIKWLVENRDRVKQHYEEKNPLCKPSIKWWIVVHALHAFLKPWNVCLQCIQGLTTLLSQQHSKIKELSEILIEDGHVDGPNDEHDSDDEAVIGAVGSTIYGKYKVTYSNAHKLLEDQGGYEVSEMLEQLKVENFEDYIDVVKSVSLLYAQSVDGLLMVIAEQDESNNPTDLLPPVVPQDLIKMRGYDFGQLLKLHKARLISASSLTGKEITRIHDEFVALKDLERRDNSVKKIIKDLQVQQVLKNVGVHLWINSLYFVYLLVH